jgi:hypothetical protein
VIASTFDSTHRTGGATARRAVLGFLLSVLLLTATPGYAYQVYYANLHAHTALSDGIGTPDEAYAYARDVANIDVLALTDHTHMMTSAEWTQLRNAATAATQAGVFVALASQEFGNLNDFGHINIDGSPFLNPGSTQNLLGTYSFIRDMGAVGAFNHPNPSYGTFFNNLQFYPEYVDAMRMMEIRNGHYSGGYEAQFNLALANGWRIGPVANQDNHEGHWGDQQNPSQGYRIYLTGILADSLTKTEVMAALHARRFFAMEVFPPSDRMELDFRVDGQPMGSEMICGSTPDLTVEARSVNGTSQFGRVDLYRDGVVRDTRAILGTEISYEHRDVLADGEEHYYYARVTQLDGDCAWSSPIWVHADVDPAAVSPVTAERLPFLGSVPDPFTTTTSVRLVAPGPGLIGGAATMLRLRVLDPAGRLVRALEAAPGAGGAVWTWDGLDDSGRAAAPGIYFLRADGPRGVAAGGRVVRVR